MLRIPKTVVVAGCGEVGKPVYQLSCGAFEQVIALDPRCDAPPRPAYEVAALHVAIPAGVSDFVAIVVGYARTYQPRVILVHSSTFPGTTDQLVERCGVDTVVHTQVHGKHKGNRMRSDMLRYPRFVATRSDQAFEKACEVLVAMGHPSESIVRLSCPMAGEMCKLLATTFFGYLIVWAQEIERLSDRCGVPYEELVSFTQLQTEDFSIVGKRSGVIGGHCVMPNIEILRKSYPSPLWDLLWNSNEQKKARDRNG